MATGNVLLTAIRGVENVNLLNSGCTLDFSERGITVIYGDNGSGKSGYTRILKKVCRARHTKGTISPNIFEEPSGNPATATIEYSIDGEERSFEWKDDGASGPCELARVCIFDNHCADFYVNVDNDIAYRPFGLDILDKLAKAADELGRSLKSQRDALVPQCPTPPANIAQNAVLKGVCPVSIETKLDAISARLSDADIEELVRLRTFFAVDDPQKKAQTVITRKTVIDKLIERLEKATTTLSKEKLRELREKSMAVEQARAVCVAISSQTFDEMLPGTGEGLWKTLWDCARKFSKGVAYIDHDYPFVAEGAVCVLCQQPLADEAVGRFLNFEKFVKNEAASRLDAARSALAVAEKEVRDVAVTDPGDEAAYSEVETNSSDLLEEAKRFHEQATRVREAALSALTSGDWTAVEAPVIDIGRFETLSQELGAEAASLTANLDVKKLSEAAARLEELESLEWIANNVAAIVAERERLQRIDGLEDSLKRTFTNKISLQANKLSTKYVTEDLRTRITEELRGINGNRLPITVSHKASKGNGSHRVEIQGKKVSNVAVREIVSEGEFRAIALAAFLAELGQSSDSSGIVIDDPVTSMDHGHREKVAQRLARESTKRQVIILTHDIVFMHDLFHAADALGQPLKVKQLARGDSNVGIVKDGPPWAGQTVSIRIDQLRERLAELKRLSENDTAHYELAGRDWYGSLRETWERAVEELILNSVVLRFSREVQTNRLERVIDLTEDDWDTLENGMGRCSRWMRGHDQPTYEGSPFPAFTELEKDMDLLSAYVKDLKKRNRSPRKPSFDPKNIIYT